MLGYAAVLGSSLGVWRGVSTVGGRRRSFIAETAAGLAAFRSAQSSKVGGVRTPFGARLTAILDESYGTFLIFPSEIAVKQVLASI